MAYSFLIFDFGGNEDVAQQARHRIDGWRQGFRLDKKLQLKFDRKETEVTAVSSGDSSKAAKSGAKAKSGSKEKSKSGDEDSQDPASNSSATDIRMIVRLDFSDHEKLSHNRWVERIPGEELFKSAKPRVIRTGDPDFKATSDLYDSLD